MPDSNSLGAADNAAQGEVDKVQGAQGDVDKVQKTQSEVSRFQELLEKDKSAPQIGGQREKVMGGRAVLIPPPDCA